MSLRSEEEIVVFGGGMCWAGVALFGHSMREVFGKVMNWNPQLLSRNLLLRTF